LLKKMLSQLMAVALSSSILLSTMATNFASQFQPLTIWTKMEIRPAQNTLYANTTSPGSVFIINATVVNVTDLQMWQLKLAWDPTLLNFSRIWLPSDHVFAASGKSMITPPPTVELGNVTWGCTYMNSPYWTFNGTGTLCQIELKILTPPVSLPVTCNLTLAELGYATYLVNGAGYDISFTAENGQFTYIDELSVSINPTSKDVNPGGNATFTASVSKGALPYKYQWYFKYPNGTEVEVVSAENQTSWVCYSINETGIHWVTVMVTDKANTRVNVSATIRISPLLIALSPSLPIVDVNTAVTFAVTITGDSPPYNIQWYRNSTEVPSLTNETIVQFNFTQVGRETIKVAVTDSALINRSDQTDVIVLSPATTQLEIIPDPATFYTNMTRVGDRISVNVTVVDVNELESWQIRFTWDPTLLEYSQTLLPFDHAFSGAVAAGKALIIPPPIVGSGYVIFNCTIDNDEPYWMFNGTGTLCQIELETLIQPAPTSSCVLSLVEKYSNNGTSLSKLHSEAVSFAIANATYNYILISHVSHSILGFIVETYSNVSILEQSVTANVTEKSIQFNAYGATGTGAYVNVTVPKELLVGPYTVFVNNSLVTAQITEDVDNVSVYVEFEFSSACTIKIRGTLIMSSHDVAVVSVTLSKTIVGQGFSTHINVTVANLGDLAETFNLTLYADMAVIVTFENINLANGNSLTITFIWNITGFNKGNFTITAYAWPVSDEAETDNNTFNESWVFVTIAGDVTSTVPDVPDGKVDMRDIGALCGKFGTTPSSPNWDTNYDINDDDLVNMRDIGLACNNFMKT